MKVVMRHLPPFLCDWGRLDALDQWVVDGVEYGHTCLVWGGVGHGTEGFVHEALGWV